ncbi:MAG: Mur ligase domain-containing protein, partial [Sphingomonadales bacterium]
MRKIPFDIGRLHFSGIGGIGMSGIAEVMHNLGYKVQGSDITENANVERLRAAGIEVKIGQRAENLKGVSAVIISSAISADNAEVIAAREQMIPVVRRADMLAELMR